MKFLLTSLLLCLSSSALADNIIYRWVDENNVVHYSQNQPATGDYTELVMANTQLSDKNNDSSTPKSNTPSSVASTNNGDGISDNLTKNKSAIDYAAKCAEAQKNLTTLKDFDRIRFVDEKGETQVLNKEQQEEQLIINEERVNIYCK
jgi:hypothetical protein